MKPANIHQPRVNRKWRKQVSGVVEGLDPELPFKVKLHALMTAKSKAIELASEHCPDADEVYGDLVRLKKVYRTEQHIDWAQAYKDLWDRSWTCFGSCIIPDDPEAAVKKLWRRNLLDRWLCGETNMDEWLEERHSTWIPVHSHYAFQGIDGRALLPYATQLEWC